MNYIEDNSSDVSDTREICTNYPADPEYFQNYLDFIDSNLMPIIENGSNELCNWSDRYSCYDFHAEWIATIISAPLDDRCEENHIGLVFESVMSALGFVMPEPIDDWGTLPLDLSDFKLTPG